MYLDFGNLFKASGKPQTYILETYLLGNSCEDKIPIKCNKPPSERMLEASIARFMGFFI